MAGGNWGRPGAPQQHRQPLIVQPPTPNSTDLKTSTKLGVTSTSSRSSIVRTPDFRTSWMPQRNSTNMSAPFSKEPPILSTSSFWVCVGGIIYSTHTLKPFKELGLDSQRVKKLASKLQVHSVNFAAKLVHTRRALFSTVINSHQEPVPGQACRQPSWSPLIFPFLFAVEELYGTRYQSGSFSLINVGSDFHCLRSFLNLSTCSGSL